MASPLNVPVTLTFSGLLFKNGAALATLFFVTFPEKSTLLTHLRNPLDEFYTNDTAVVSLAISDPAVNPLFVTPDADFDYFTSFNLLSSCLLAIRLEPSHV
jgi:hypothetical protein